uniref:Sugar phosphate isomerase/epimerase n=1 Tax=Ignisphaera aggregans TaxID=334771 RepID=A0A7J3I846_9CREN
MKFSAVYVLEEEIPFKIGIQAPIQEVLTFLTTRSYNGVELHIPNPFNVNIDTLKRNLNEYGLEVSAISTGLSYVKYGYSLSSENEDNRLKAIAFFKKYIEVAYLLDSKVVVVGTARGKCSIDCRAAKTRLTESLSLLGSYSRDFGVWLVLEPMNRRETDLINRIGEAMEVIQQVDNVYLLLDTYHILLEEGNVYEIFQKYGGYAKHIHVADTHRLPPGLGELDWSKILKILDSIGYGNYVSVEALMEPDYVTALEVAIKTLKTSLKGHHSSASTNR